MLGLMQDINPKKAKPSQNLITELLTEPRSNSSARQLGSPFRPQQDLVQDNLIKMNRIYH